MVSLTLLRSGLVYSTVTSPLTGGVSFFPARTDFIGAAGGGVWATDTAAPMARATRVAPNDMRARFITSSRENIESTMDGIITVLRILHLPVPVLRFGVHGAENLHVPLASAPGLNNLCGDDVDEQLRKKPPFRVAFEVVRRFVPAKVRVERQREKQVVPVVDDDELPAGSFEGGM